ncbi:MAG: PAS domain-containing sensor histidine kinase, partial [Sphingobacteriaceae bacterium]
MPLPESPAPYHLFLQDGGEMGELTRSFDWSKTVLGSPENWSQSLRTTLGILLHSRFPMFLFWGEYNIQFYNDAYRPSLGNAGKHPKALGQKGEECWPEIWPTIKPMIDQVIISGKSTWQQDRLIPIYRNKRLEDVYWTFSYSQVNDSNGKTGGVLVICQETTEQVLSRQKILNLNNGLTVTNRNLQLSNEKLWAMQQDLTHTVNLLKESEAKFRSIIEQAPVAIAIFRGPKFVIEEYNEKVLEYWGRTAKQVKNIPLFEALPEASGQGFEQLLTQVLHTGERFVANELPVTILRNGILNLTWINFIYEPLKNHNEHITAIIVVCLEVTDQVKARKSLELMLQQKDEFINVASHELKTPVTSLKASMQLLDRMKHNPSPAVLSKLIEQSNRSLHKLNGLINELLHTNRIAQGKLQLVKTMFTVKDMIGDCFSGIHNTTEHQFILQGDMNMEIHADEQQIEQVMANLIDNAVKYAPNSLEIILKAEKTARAVKISVTDKGPGVLLEKL